MLRSADALLVRNLRPRIVDLCMGRFRVCRLLFSAATPTRSLSRFSGRCTCRSSTSAKSGYGYGWEIQLLETGFLSIFLCPLLDGRPFPKCRPPIARYLAFSLARLSHHDRRRSRSNCAATHAGAILPAFTITTKPSRSRIRSVVICISRRTGSTNLRLLWNHFIELVVPWFSFGPRTRPAHRRRLARQFSNRSHHQRQSLVSELCHDHSVSCLL